MTFIKQNIKENRKIQLTRVPEIRPFFFSIFPFPERRRHYLEWKTEKNG